MHYNETSFSKNGQKTIIPIDSNSCNITSGIISSGLSYMDKICIETLYPTGKPPFLPTICPTNYPTNIPTSSTNNPSIPPTLSPVPTTVKPTKSPTIPTIFPTKSPITKTDPLCITGVPYFFNSLNGGYIYDGEYNGFSSYKGTIKLINVCTETHYIWSTSGNDNQWIISPSKGNGVNFVICSITGLETFQECSGFFNFYGISYPSIQVVHNTLYCPSTTCSSISITSNIPIYCEGFYRRIDVNQYQGTNNGYYFYYDDNLNQWICDTNIDFECNYDDFYGRQYNNEWINGLIFDNSIDIPWQIPSRYKPTNWVNNGSYYITVSCQIIPSFMPTFSPSNTPTASPSTAPSLSPTLSPTNLPSISPTTPPTMETNTPTITPTLASLSPTIITNPPSTNPTSSPSISPTLTSLSPTIITNTPIHLSLSPSLSTSSPSLSPTFSPTLGRRGRRRRRNRNAFSSVNEFFSFESETSVAVTGGSGFIVITLILCLIIFCCKKTFNKNTKDTIDTKDNTNDQINNTYVNNKNDSNHNNISKTPNLEIHMENKESSHTDMNTPTEPVYHNIKSMVEFPELTLKLSNNSSIKKIKKSRSSGIETPSTPLRPMEPIEIDFTELCLED